MNILLVGSGGREHALAWKLAQSPLLDTLFAAPGNPGIAQHATIADLDVADHRAVIDFVRRQQIGLVVVGPEGPLVDGLADNVRAIGVPVFGPGREAARLEGSKGFTKDLCARVGIPTARYFRVTSRDGALACLDDFGDTCVIKADGLAAGKGVVVADTRAEAEAAIRDLYANGPVEAVIEERLEGPEASLFVLSDGSATAVFGSAQDHKRVGDGDTGPNTGGMGAYSPALVLTPELEERALGEIVRPTIDALAAAGTPYVGVLYAGLMLTADGPKLIEYNVRFGDPECQVLMMRFAGDLAEVLLAVAEGRLADLPAPAFADDAALTVVMAASGYPGTPEKGGAIAGIAAAERDGAVVFQAGTARRGEQLVADGGRVLAVTARGADIAAAQRAAYAAVDAIDFPSGFFRRDIGAKAIDEG
ncbi:phosphoribosylamine--glycine ligase [Sphingomonas ginsenosidimutans]|jgi:phosphoribosylamine--glycine ligase|uniref:Phosphoribosylamine--glycine ligase n=1 Tax=Sphingomonas ginsenosidimutans TaxID=862134 RepID=A0A2A4HZQ2_9SPHN|nr:phosphoribosylamine--glycine ligase [Sphingomonas ginsenosidimutans]MEE2916836.1 phosphoribosylamine--glycine ligase [Pseudomonadota bacterium]PCG10352.1 phosphoribosylamine--glycine ligase [Sphingomonas ginsenosidimutans]